MHFMYGVFGFGLGFGLTGGHFFHFVTTFKQYAPVLPETIFVPFGHTIGGTGGAGVVTVTAGGAGGAGGAGVVCVTVEIDTDGGGGDGVVAVVPVVGVVVVVCVVVVVGVVVVEPHVTCWTPLVALPFAPFVFHDAVASSEWLPDTVSGIESEPDGPLKTNVFVVIVLPSCLTFSVIVFPEWFGNDE